MDRPLSWKEIAYWISCLPAAEDNAKILLPNGQFVYATGIRVERPCLIVQTEDKVDFSTEDE